MNLTKFQIFFFFIAILLIAVALFFFATYRGQSESYDKITIWGTVESQLFETYINDLVQVNKVKIEVSYIQMSETQLGQALLESLAANAAPDAVLMSHEMALKNTSRLYDIPFTLISDQQFKDTFIQGAEIYTTQNGHIALPFLVDPLVLYWNRPMLSDAGLTVPPRFWDELPALTAILTKKDSELNILKTTIALGEYSNVVNAKEILATLLMQAGTPLVQRSTSGTYRSALAERYNYTISPAETALNFYTQFANPIKTVYSWNRSLMNSRDYFTAGDSAFYIGYASEYQTLVRKNPNLDIGVTLVPQARTTDPRLVYGKMYGFSIVRKAGNAANTFTVLSILTNPANAALMQKFTNLPPAHRELLAIKPINNAAAAVFYDSAIRSRAWYDVNKEESNTIFQALVESITTGRNSLTGAISEANSKLQSVVQQQ